MDCFSCILTSKIQNSIQFFSKWVLFSGFCFLIELSYCTDFYVIFYEFPLATDEPIIKKIHTNCSRGWSKAVTFQPE